MCMESMPDKFVTNDGTSVLIDEVKKVFAGDQYIVQCKNKVLGLMYKPVLRKMSFQDNGGENRTFLHLWDTWVEEDYLYV